jgi:hypothetical protein
MRIYVCAAINTSHHHLPYFSSKFSLPFLCNMEMEFSSIRFFSFSSLLSLVFLTTGLYSLDKATIFAPHDWIKHGIQACIASSVIYSISYAFLFRPLWEQRRPPAVRKLIAFYDPFHPELIKSLIISIFLLYCFFHSNQDKVNLIILLVFSLPLNVCFFCLTLKYVMPYKNRDRNGNLLARTVGPLLLYPHHSLCWACLIIFLFFSLRTNFEDKYKHMFLGSFVGFGLDFVLSFSIWYFSLLPMKFPRSDSSILIYAYKQRKLLEIIVGIISTVLAQYFFREKSVPLMFAFLSFAITWLGNLANVQPSTDLGIFHFFVSSSLECAVSLFGLHFYTFLVLCGCIVLEILRWKIESVSLKHTGIRHSIFFNLVGLEQP